MIRHGMLCDTPRYHMIRYMISPLESGGRSLLLVGGILPDQARLDTLWTVSSLAGTLDLAVHVEQVVHGLLLLGT